MMLVQRHDHLLETIPEIRRQFMHSADEFRDILQRIAHVPQAMTVMDLHIAKRLNALETQLQEIENTV